MSALLCATLFFIYPGVGFKQEIIQFEATYSILTHALLLVSSITLITLKHCDFTYKQFPKFALSLIIIFAYAFFETFVLKIESDPMYFMPQSDVMEILHMSYGVYLTLYVCFLVFYFNIFYLVNDNKSVKNYFKNLLFRKRKALQ